MARYFTRLRLVKYLAISHADSCNKSYIFFAVLCTYFSIHSTNFVRKMIPTFLKVKVCDSQRTFYLDQSSRPTTVQSYGKGEGHINCHKSQKFALFSEKPNS